MSSLKTSENKIFDAAGCRKFILFFSVFNLLLLFFSGQQGLGDFGNYYYGSKFFLQGIDPIKFYRDLHFFNSEIRSYENGVFFENYAPVPPFSLVFYAPFTVLPGIVAKTFFSLLSIALFGVALYRILRQLNFFSSWLYLLPLCFLMPLYSNISNGQTYLLITALMLECLTAFCAQSRWRVGIIVALLFSLKIFPAAIALVLILFRDWRSLSWTATFVMLFQGITWLFVGHEVFAYYYCDILPRLAENSVIEPFGYHNQSLHTFLQRIFVYHPYLNSAPLLNAPFLAMLIQSILYGFIVSFLLQARLRHPSYVTFAYCNLAIILFSQYSTVYGLLTLVPLALLFRDFWSHRLLVIYCLLALAINVPVHRIDEQTFLIQFCRPLLLFLASLLLANYLGYEFKAKRFAAAFCIVLALSFNFYAFDTQPRQNLSGKRLLYDFTVGDTTLFFNTCYGNRDSVECISFKKDRMDSLTVMNSGLKVVADHKVIYESKGNIKKCLLVNDTSLLVLTDEERGIGMYRLIMKKLKL